jgi:hypothetical protein
MLNNENNNNNNNNNNEDLIVINDPGGRQQDRVVRFLFMAWIIYSLMWRAPDATELARNQPLALDVPIANDGRAVRNMQLFRNASSVALIDFFVPRGDKERLAATLKLSARIVHRATPFRPIPGAVATFYQHDDAIVNSSAALTAAQWAALRQRMVASVRQLSSLNVWALMFKVELGTDMTCVGVCERGGDRHCVGVPDVFQPSRCWMPVDDECLEHRAATAAAAAADAASPAEATQDARRNACYGLASLYSDAQPRADDIAVAPVWADLRFRWFANRTCVSNPRACGAPIERLRGDVARAVLYGELVYGASKTPGDLLQAVSRVYFDWADSDPVDDIERRRNELLFAAQRTRNPWIDFADNAHWHVWRPNNTQ